MEINSQDKTNVKINSKRSFRHGMLMMTLCLIVIFSCLGFGITYAFFANKSSASAKANIGVLKLDGIKKADGTDFVFENLTVAPNEYLVNEDLKLSVNSSVSYYTRVLVFVDVTPTGENEHANGENCEDYVKDDIDIFEISVGGEDFKKADNLSVNRDMVFYKLAPSNETSTTLPFSIKLAEKVGEGKCQYYMNAKITLSVRVELLQADYLNTSASGSTFEDTTTLASKWETIYPTKFDPEKFEGTLEDVSWEMIDIISKSGKASEVFKVGEEKTFQMTNGENVTMVILGFDHDDLSDGSGKAGITLGMKNLLKNQYKMNDKSVNAGGWEESKMRKETMSSLFEQLPEALQKVIKTVNKKTSAGNQSKDITTSQDKLWLLSITEIWFEDDIRRSKWDVISRYVDTFKNEGTQYEYYANLAKGQDPHDPNDRLIKKLNNGTGEIERAWLRSPTMTANDGFLALMFQGNISHGAANLDPSVCFNFCI